MRRPRKLLYSYGKAAEAMGVGRNRIVSLVEEGKLGVCLVQNKPMIPLESLQEYIRMNTVMVIPTRKRTPKQVRKTQEIPTDETCFYCKICNKFTMREPGRFYWVEVCPKCSRMKKNKAAIEELKVQKYQAIKDEYSGATTHSRKEARVS